MKQSVGVVLAIRRHAGLIQETLDLRQSTVAVAWLFCGIFLGAQSLSFFNDWTLVPLVVAVFTAQFSGVCWNSLIDWRIDRYNPRTCDRVVPRGRCRPEEMAACALVTLFSFLVSCSFLPITGRWIGVVIAVGVVVCGFVKRISYGRHFIMGLLYGALPFVGTLWVSHSISLAAVFLTICAFAVTTSADILYKLQDESFDRKIGFESIPVRFGRETALEVAASLSCIGIIAGTFVLLKGGFSVSVFIVWALTLCGILKIWRTLWIQTENRLLISIQYLSLLFPLGLCLGLFIRL